MQPMSVPSSSALLATTYFGPVQWYQKLCRYPIVEIERMETFPKQTYRNRCVIATANGLQTLTVPVSAPASVVGSAQGESMGRALTKDMRISDHGNWRHLHRNALITAYSDSPFFQYYADDILPFFERRWQFLYDFNMEITLTLCRLLDIHPLVRPTHTFRSPSVVSSATLSHDFRAAIHPKHPLPDATFTARPYYQVYRSRHGFQPNLSILDLLFNEGNESIFYLL